MTAYIALLRGINVSGKNPIKMADLRILCESLGFTQVSTYIQSGNIIFKADEEHSTLVQRIHDAIAEKYSYDVPVMVYSTEAWQEIVAANPFAETVTDVKTLHMTLLADEPDDAAIHALAERDFSPDEYQIIGKMVYLHCPNGYGRTKLNNTFWEKAFNTSATTRNWKTTLKLLELCAL